MAKSVERKPAKSPEERRKAIAREAAKLARAQGLNWKELPREQRQEFKRQVGQIQTERRARRESARSAGTGE